MLVFRIEDASGAGAYSSDCEEHPSDIETQPSPWNDPGLRRTWERLETKGIAGTYRFGCKSMDQLRRWFNCNVWRRAAHASGLRITVYKIDGRRAHPSGRKERVAYHGSKQVIFYRQAAQPIRTLPIAAL